jgi:hypothetical protein
MEERELAGLKRHSDRNLVLIRDACRRQGGNLDLLKKVERILKEREFQKEKGGIK